MSVCRISPSFTPLLVEAPGPFLVFGADKRAKVASTSLACAGFAARHAGF